MAALLTLSLQTVLLTGFARADDGQPLLPREAVLDTAPSVPSSGDATGSDTAAALQPPGGSARSSNWAAPTKLNGGISHTDKIHGSPDSGDMRQTQFNNIMDLLKAARQLSGNYNVQNNGKTVEQGNIDFVSRAPSMSSEEFRRLEHGVIGLNAVLRLDEEGPMITEVLPTCPAALAGMLPGDILVKAGDHVFREGEGQRILWQVVGGRAGTPVDITVLRKGQQLTFHLTRMNIEDIKDEHIRGNYERLLSALGPPGQH